MLRPPGKAALAGTAVALALLVPPAAAGVPSTPTLVSPSRPFVKQKSFLVSWTASTAEAGIQGYEVQYRTARWNGGFGAYATWQAMTAATSAKFVGSPGSTYCFSVRALDLAGAVSEWSAEACTAVPLDDRALAAKGRWFRERGRGYYLRTYSVAFAKGAALARTGVVAKQLALVATKCDSGRVKIFWNGTLLEEISLASAVVRKKQLFPIATFAAAETGTLRIVVSSRRMPVEIEGLGISAV